VEYFRQKQAAAVEWMRRHPQETAALIAQHIRYFWLPPGADTYRHGRGLALYTLARQALTAAAFAGLIVLWRQKRQLAQMLAGILLVYPIVYYLVNWSSRYRAPIEWILILLAAVLVGAAAEWKTRRAVTTTAEARDFLPDDRRSGLQAPPIKRRTSAAAQWQAGHLLPATLCCQAGVQQCASGS
jgi:hypothetical protein